MSLPKLDLPRYDHTLFSTKAKIKFRPFTVKEQKIILQAKEEKDKSVQVNAMKQIIELCTFGTVNVDTLAFFDVEDLFLKIRMRSVSDESVLSFRDKTNPDDTKNVIKVTVDLKTVGIVVPEGHTKKIALTDKQGIVMKYPTIEDIYSVEESKKEDLALLCIDYVYDGDSIYNDFSKEELVEFVDGFDTSALIKIREFFKTMPRLRHKQKVKLSNGTEQEIEFEGLTDFFP